MKRILKYLFYVLFAAFLVSQLASCKARKNDCDCPRNVNGKVKAPKAYKSNIYRK